jgi:hypothetical protein
VSCQLCYSENEAELTAEIMIHFNDRKHLDNFGVLAYPTIVVCLDCGSTGFKIPETEVMDTRGRCRAVYCRLNTGVIEFTNTLMHIPERPSVRRRFSQKWGCFLGAGTAFQRYPQRVSASYLLVISSPKAFEPNGCLGVPRAGDYHARAVPSQTRSPPSPRAGAAAEYKL